MLTIRDAFNLPSPDEIRAMRFVIRLQDADAKAKQLVEDYVVTPAVAKELPSILEDVKQVCNRGEEYGRFIHGSFGSGKSHFMSMLGLLFEDDEEAWSKNDPVFKAISSHRAWIRQQKFLVVRLHMLSTKGRDTGLDRAVYEAFNQALKKHGKPAFEFLNVNGVIEEARREGEIYRDQFWTQLDHAQIVGSKNEFEEIVSSGDIQAREAFARAYLAFKGRDAASAGIDPRWAEGLQRMAAHAKDQGFGAIVFMIDEFLLWLAEKSGQEFVSEINNLNVVVDHSTGQRPVPIFAFVARQRNLKEFFPDLVTEDKIHEHLDHHSKRFEVTRLEDVELRHIVKGRVLRPKVLQAVNDAVASLAERHKVILPALLGRDDVGYLTDVYPFHPALIETLVDVTSLMQRERSALRLLYELLVVHYPDLPLGEFLPVGSAFDAIFPEAGVEASKKAELLQEIHKQYHQRIKVAIAEMAKEAEKQGEPMGEERRTALEQVVKTVLLGEVSTRLKGAGLTIERLVHLNYADIEGESNRGRMLNVESDLKTLSRHVPDLQIIGTRQTAIVGFVLGKVSLTELLARARAKVDNPAQRFKCYYSVLKRMLGIENIKGFRDSEANEGEIEVFWRGTKRKGMLKLGNVREMTYEEFKAPPRSFKLLIDYPWDDPGCSVELDRQRADKVRKTEGNQYSLCWLPRHLSPSELSLLTDLAAVKYLRTDEGQVDLLGTMSSQDRTQALDQADKRETSLTSELETLLVKVFKDHGEIKALTSDIDGSRPYPELSKTLEHLAKALLDRRFGAHPHFVSTPKKNELELVAAWMARAAEAGSAVPIDEDTRKAIEVVAKPLELVSLGETKASLMLDSRYLKGVLHSTDRDSVEWTAIANGLSDEFGFQMPIVNLFLMFLCSHGYRALHAVSGEVVEVGIETSANIPIRLQRAKLLEPAAWSLVRELASRLFPGETIGAHRSLSAQDACVAVLKKRGVDVRKVLQGLQESLDGLGVPVGSPRREEIKLAIGRLAPLVKTTTDSHEVLSALLQEWPDDASDPVREVVTRAGGMQDAIDKLDRKTRLHLEKVSHNPIHGTAVQAHLEALADRLAAAEASQPVIAKEIERWNQRAHDLLSEVLVVPPPPPPPPPLPPVPPAPKTHDVTRLEKVMLKDDHALDDLVEELRARLKAYEGKTVTIVVSEDAG